MPRCSPLSRSFLPGQDLRSGGIWQLSGSTDRHDQPIRSVHAFRGTPRDIDDLRLLADIIGVNSADTALRITADFYPDEPSPPDRSLCYMSFSIDLLPRRAVSRIWPACRQRDHVSIRAAYPLAGWLVCGSIGLVTVIYLVQHGDKVRLPGDPGLTELGRDQAAATARWLEGEGLQALFSSPLRRAQETAAAIAAATGLPVQLDDRLRERLNWDGAQTFDAFAANWDRSARDRDFTPGNGESSRSAGDRMRAFVTGLCGRSGPVAAVSHGGATTDLLRTLLGDEALPLGLLAGGIRPCAVTTLDDLRVVAIASTEHLR